MKTNLPVDCVIAVTYKCNARCVMCDIWKIKEFPELPVAEFAKLPASLRDINLSGGEPFLRPDLPEIVAVAQKACPRARMVISTNGFAMELILKKMAEILKIKPDIGVAVSIDGIGETHNELRGIPGGFDRATRTVEGLLKMGMKNIRLSFTVMSRNASQMSKVYDLSQKMGVQFTHSFAQSSEIYFGGKDNSDNAPEGEELVRQYRHLIGSELKSWNVKRWLRAFFAFGMYKFITGREALLDNAPGRDFFFLDPSGDVYPSVVHNVKLGNLREMKNLAEGWFSESMETAREKTDALKIPVWMICTARTAIKKHPFRVGWWILKNKIKFDL